MHFYDADRFTLRHETLIMPWLCLSPLSELNFPYSGTSPSNHNRRIYVEVKVTPRFVWPDATSHRKHDKRPRDDMDNNDDSEGQYIDKKPRTSINTISTV